MEREANVEVLDFDKSQNIEVLVQEEVQLDINVPLFYIKSGEEDIKAYVNNHAKPELDAHTTSAVDKINQAEASSIADMEIAKDIQVAAVNQAGQIATENVAEDAIEIVDNHANSVTIPQLQEFTAEAQTQATNAATSASSALASKTSAESYATQAKTSETNAKSYADSIEPERFLSKEMITNCITEIPQDIKLELNNGILTLKAGSKVYVPNGFETDGVTPKFDEVVIESDIVNVGATSSDTNVRFLYYCNGGISYIYAANLSGTTPPTSGTNQVFYNTEDNTIKRYTGGSVVDTNYSLPLALVKAGNNRLINSIDQVFNGFGYIGSTVFALPNVKGLIPNGRNADGTLKNEEFTTDKVLTYTTSYDYNGDNTFKFIYKDGVLSLQQGYASFWFEGSYKNIPPKQYAHLLNTDDNEWYYCPNGDAWIIDPIKYCVYTENCGLDTNGVITSFSPKQPFHAVDRNDSSWIAQQAMPSGKYIDLTLGAAGIQYTAPANGWYYLRGLCNSAGAYAYMTNIVTNMRYTTQTYTSNTTIAGYLPCKKGDKISCEYSNFTKQEFRFIYAEGEK